MSSLYEKYKWFQQGIVKAGVEPSLQKLFKTKLTDEQMMLLSERERMRDIAWLCCILGYFAMGMALGYLIWYVIPETIAKIGA